MLYTSRFIRLTPIPMKGPDVELAQTRLKLSGYDPGNIDGIWGPKSDLALRAFQRARKLQEDGIIGPASWNEINSPLPTPGPVLRFSSDKPETSITINLETRFLTLKCDNDEKIYPVAVGKPSTPTPPGDWIIIQKARDPGGPFGKRWMRLNIPWGGYGIHGTNNPRSIGTYASHGCIRMYNNDVVDLYDQVSLGTTVHISGSAFTGRILKVGIRGTDVKALQEMLQDLGYYNGPTDGLFADETMRAVQRFQKAQGLKTDGIVGPLTYQAILLKHDIKTENALP